MSLTTDMLIPARAAEFRAAMDAAGVVDPVARGGGSVYLGQIGCRTRIADNLSAVNTQAMHRRADFARDVVASIQIVYGNFYTDTTSEISPAGSRTIASAIEYPAGVMNRVKFAGADSVAIASGQAQQVSDVLAITIPKGAQFWVHTWQQAASGVMTFASQLSSAALGDQALLGAADGTASTAWLSGAAFGGGSFGPYAIIANTRRASSAVIGDSRACNATATSSVTNYGGSISPSIAPFIPVLDLSRGTQAAMNWVAGGGAKRLTYLVYVSHVVLELGINDVIQLQEAAQILASRQVIRALGNAVNPALIWFETTLEPVSTSTDAWVTVPNQTTSTRNGRRVPFNEQVRAGNLGFEGYFELADRVESSRNSGKWKAPPMVEAAITGDGTHAIAVGYALQDGAVEPRRFTRAA